MKQVYGVKDAMLEVYRQEEKMGETIYGEKRRRKRMKRTKFEISRGDLTSLGYHLSKSSRSRHIALGKAIRKYGYTETMRKLTFLKGPARLTKTQKRKVATDMNWLKKKYGKRER